MQVQSQQQQDQQQTTLGVGKGPTPSQQDQLVLCMPTGIDISQPPAPLNQAGHANGEGRVESMLSYFPSSSLTLTPLPPQMMNSTTGQIEAHSNSYPSSLSVSPSSSSYRDLMPPGSFLLPPSRTQSVVTDDTTGESETDDGKNIYQIVRILLCFLLFT